MVQRSRTTRLVAGILSICTLLLAGAVTPAPAVAGPLPCLAPVAADLLDEGAVLKTSLTTYRTTTSYAYWSVVATRGSQGYDSDIVLHDQSGCVLTSSIQGGFVPTDWIAFDNNPGRLPYGPYPTRVNGHPGNTSPVKYMVQFVKGTRSLSTSSLFYQPIGDSYTDWLVDIRDIQLSAGTTYTFTVTGGLSALHLLGSDSTNPASWAKTAATANYSLLLPGTDLNVWQTDVLEVTPTKSGWYGALFVRNGWSGAPVWVQVSST